ncbi:hypothetical protein RJ639_015757 [Escallonia herrerae]|uniref:Uncharacterized protein n=1 Tax=Escallonia herrerae TaxID=1293975 RepID=A0AA89ANF0_9ASTE|nr:hypothetical protein RJ639_015757 [Escallonia herrerae]
MVKPYCCSKMNVKRGVCTEQKDAPFHIGTGKCTAVPKAGLRRCGKSCKPRHESFTPEEEELIIKLHAAIGSRWLIIAQQLPGRTDNDVKNHWNAKLRKQLSERGIDHVTHRPFSQILADYANIGNLPKSRTEVEYLKRDLKNTFVLLSEKSPIPTEYFPNFQSHLTPKLEPTQESILSSSYNHQPLDLFGQLQALTLATKASNCTNQDTIQPHHFLDHDQCSSSALISSSSASSSSSIGHDKSPTESFSWHEFLLEEEYLPQGAKEKENLENFSAKPMQAEEISRPKAFEEKECSTSFMEAMLDQENDMLLDFTRLLDEPFNY